MSGDVPPPIMVSYLGAGRFKVPSAMSKPLDKDILHMLGGRAKRDADAGLTTSRIETEYLAELVRLAGTVLFPAFRSTKQ